MKKHFQIIVTATFAICILKILHEVQIINSGTAISDAADSSLMSFNFITITISVIIYFLANFRIAAVISSQKHKYWKLFFSTLAIGLFSYVFLFLIQLMAFTYFPQYDTNAILFKDLHLPYSGPKLDLINEILLRPFIQLYYFLPGIHFFSMDVIMFLLSQPIFLSFIIPVITLTYRNKISKAKRKV